jgi:hypothetical protein
MAASHVLCAVLCFSSFALTSAQQKAVENFSEFNNAAEELAQLDAASKKLHVATTQLKATAQTTKLSSGEIPNTWHVCEDVAYLYTKANDLQNKLQYAQGKLKKFCKQVKTTVDTCDKICKIKTATTTADLILTPLKSLPYIGPVLKVASPIVKSIKVKTTTARKCKDYITSLNMKEMNTSCPKAEQRLNDTNIRMSLIFADIEIAQELWCTCDSPKTENSAEVKKGCNEAQKSKKFGTCAKPVNCTGHKEVGLRNAKEIALRCPAIARPKIEQMSGIVNHDIRRLKVCISTTFDALIKMDQIFFWLAKLDFMIHAEVPVVNFWNVLAPLDWFLTKIRNALDRTITITMPGCPSSTTSDVLTKLTEQQLNERVIKATGMNLTEAMRPLTGKEYANHPEVLKFRRQFEKTLKLTPIHDWYQREQMLQLSKETSKAMRKGATQRNSAAAQRKREDGLRVPVKNSKPLSPMNKTMSRLHTESQNEGAKTMITAVPTSSSPPPDPAMKANMCKDAPNVVLQEANGPISSCAQASAQFCKDHPDDAHRYCPVTCKACDPSQLPKETCKITQKDVVHAPEDEVPVGFTDYQPLITSKGYCIEGSTEPAKPYKALNCSAGGMITELSGVYCHDPSAPAKKHRYVPCVTCASLVLKANNGRRLLHDEATGLSDAVSRPDKPMAPRHFNAHPNAANVEDLAVFDDATSHTKTQDLVEAETQKLWGGGRRRRRRWHAHVPHRHHWHVPHRHHFHIPHRWHVHVPHRHHFHVGAIVQSIGHGVISAVKKIGELYCYKIKFNVMDIIKGIGNFLSWMMRPIELAMKGIFDALGITLPGIPGLPTNLPLPPWPELNLNWAGDFLSFNWDAVIPSLKKLAAFSLEVPKLGC